MSSTRSSPRIESAALTDDGLEVEIRYTGERTRRVPLGRMVAPESVLADPTLTGADVSAHASWVEITLSDGSQHRSRLPPPPGVPAWQPGDPVDLLLVGAGTLLTGVPGAANGLIAGSLRPMPEPESADRLGLVEGGAVAVAAGRVVAVGPEEAVRRVSGQDDATLEVNVGGRLVTPGLVDPHTHPVFAGDRSEEFALRAEGATYQEISARGGGILATVRATRAADEDALLRSAARRLGRLLSHGVTTVEAKSGYALEFAGELKLLRVLRRLGAALPLQISPTFLGAHVVPPEYHDRREGYVALLCDRCIPEVARQGLAESVDVFCEEGAFTRDESEQILRAARTHHLATRIHAEQFTDQGGAAMAARLGAVSADHLEAACATALEAMAAAGTVGVLLPGAALTLRCPWPPVARMRRAGVPIALGTDLNPGTSMTANLPLMMSLGCMQMGMTVEEAWRAVTQVAARAALRPEAGRLAPGAPGDLVIWDAERPAEIPYRLGENLVAEVYVAGRLAVRRAEAPAESSP